MGVVYIKELETRIYIYIYIYLYIRQEETKMDYTSGKIYQTLNNVNGDVYVGSTVQLLCKRFYCLKSHSDTLFGIIN